VKERAGAGNNAEDPGQLVANKHTELKRMDGFSKFKKKKKLVKKRGEKKKKNQGRERGYPGGTHKRKKGKRGERGEVSSVEGDTSKVVFFESDSCAIGASQPGEKEVWKTEEMETTNKGLESSGPPRGEAIGKATQLTEKIKLYHSGKRREEPRQKEGGGRY